MATTIPEAAVMPEAVFRRMLTADLRTDDWSVWEHPQVIERSCQVLTSLVRDTDTQLAALEAERLAARYTFLTAGDRAGWQKAQVEFAQKKVGKIRFRVAMEDALLRMKRLRDAMHRVSFEEAIEEHRRTLLADDHYEPDPADTLLWSHLTDSRRRLCIGEMSRHSGRRSVR